jgi:hypothetical protein
MFTDDLIDKMSNSNMAEERNLSMKILEVAILISELCIL